MLAKKYILSLLILLVLAVIIAGVVGVYQGGLTKPPQHKVGDSIDGIYAVYFSDALIGHLTLSKGRYSFKLQDNQEFTKLIAEKIYFGRYPNGSFSIRYYDYLSVDQNTILEDLKGGVDILFDIIFNADGPGPDWDKYSTANFSVFVLTSNNIKKELYLQFTPAVAERWHIFKPWE